MSAVEVVYLHQTVTHIMPERGNCDTACGTTFAAILAAKRTGERYAYDRVCRVRKLTTCPDCIEVVDADPDAPQHY